MMIYFEQGKFDERIKVKRNDEMTDVAAACFKTASLHIAQQYVSGLYNLAKANSTVIISSNPSYAAIVVAVAKKVIGRVVAHT